MRENDANGETPSLTHDGGLMQRFLDLERAAGCKMHEDNATAFAAGVSAAIDAILNGHSLACVHRDAGWILAHRAPEVFDGVMRARAERN